jgi:hypothetical protein
MQDEKGADDEFRGGHMLAGKKPGEFSARLQFIRRDRLSVELIELVQATMP